MCAHAVAPAARCCSDKIKDIVNVHPRDEVSDGVAFWGPGKRFPTGPETLDLDDEMNMQFIISTSNIFAVIFGLVNDPEDEEAGGPVPAGDQKRDPVSRVCRAATPLCAVVALCPLRAAH